VNMSWGDSQDEIEQWLDKTSTEKDPNKRSNLRRRFMRCAGMPLRARFRLLPNTLWVLLPATQTGNASFLGDVPASLDLPN